MATSKNKIQCFVCNKEKNTYSCKGCSNEFCFPHLKEHRQRIETQLEEIINDHDQFQQTIIQQKQNPDISPLIDQINQWETNSIHQIQLTAQQCREKVMKSTQKNNNDMEKKFIELSKKLKEIREENEFNEIDLNHFQLKLTQITEEFLQLSNISIRQDLHELIKKTSVKISLFGEYILIGVTAVEQIQIKKNKFQQFGVTVAGGNGKGENLNQLRCPDGIFIDNEKSICIADGQNHRIVKWKVNSNQGQIIAGRNEQGNQNNQLRFPTDIIFDSENNSLIISDLGNKRVIRCFDQNQANQQIIISNINCYGLTIDKNGFIYVCDCENDEVRRWKQGDKKGELVAGGNGQGDHLNQLHYPHNVFVDEDDSLYISDSANNRVMKWKKDAKEGIIVAGENGHGDSLKQLWSPRGVIVDDLGQIYVADFGNNRVMRWCEGKEEGEIVVGGNGEGNQSNQMSLPCGLSFDDEGNLYVADFLNHRIQKYEKL
ncbi:unnamed protein product [Adineta steineri]|uniref:Uncharacterized protein n=1 Tax=Adineta steineri TaxID=433720 RepID=A0A819JMR8_9BILA|nr:unnamed protein product [Adineta steineri]